MQSPRRAAGSANERAQSGRRRGTPLRETWLLVRPVPLVSGLLAFQLSELLVKPWRGAERDASKKHNENSRRPPVHAARNAGLSPMPSFSVTRLP